MGNDPANTPTTGCPGRSKGAFWSGQRSFKTTTLEPATQKSLEITKGFCIVVTLGKALMNVTQKLCGVSSILESQEFLT